MPRSRKWNPRLWRRLQRSASLSDPSGALHPETMMTLLKRLFAPLAAPLAALLAIASPAAAATAPARPAHPALWAVSDADTTIYLFGTIHLLPEHYQWRTAKF